MGKGESGLLLGGLGLAFIIMATSKKGSSSASSSSNPLDTKDIRLPFDGKLTTYVRLCLPYAIEANKQFPKVPVTLILTQSALESAYGKAAPGNMFFGHKAGKNYTGDKQLLKTTEILPKATGYSFPEVISITKLPPDKNGVVKYRWVVRDWFRKYPTPLGSFLDYAKLISSPHYAKAIAVSPDVNKMIVQIKAAGYATDPNYVPKVQQLATLVQAAVKNAA